MSHTLQLYTHYSPLSSGLTKIKYPFYIFIKTNIKNSTINASNKLSQAVLRSFNWLKDGRLEQCGFVAQEIEAVFGEEFVLKVKQADGSVNYQIKEYPFIPLLVKAFQESNEKIMRLEHEVAILKSKGETTC